MNIFLINLDKRPDRLEFVSKQLQALKLSFKRIPAIDGSILSKNHTFFNNEKFIIHNKKQATIGEIGCYESHKLIWKEMINEEISHALILEDDVKINDTILDFLRSKTYSNYDFINLSSSKGFTPTPAAINYLKVSQKKSRPLIFSKQRKKWNSMTSKNHYKIFQIEKTRKNMIICECDPAPVLASGYILSLKAAQSFLKRSKDFYFPVDYIWRYSTGDLHQSFIHPPIVNQTFGDTNIVDRDQNYQLSFKQKLKRLLFRDRRIGRKFSLLKMYGLKYF